MSACPPVLVIAYRRPATTRLVLDAIADAKPSEIFLSINAPNTENPSELSDHSAVCEMAHELERGVGATVRIRSDHVSARESIASSIDWFFSHVQSGIVLEDDCLPDPTFFYYAGELLDRYEGEKTVAQISGASHLDEIETDASYYFTKYPQIWGWATWRDRWAAYRETGETLDRHRLRCVLDQTFSTAAEREYWRHTFDYVSSGRLDSWDSLWAFSIWANSWHCISPDRNLVSNLGFGEGATNTSRVDERFANRETLPMPFPLKHPPVEVAFCEEIDRRIAEDFYRIFDSHRAWHWKLRLAKRLPVRWKKVIKKHLAR
ncbi:MAG: hypothetical protein AAF357_01190 [Verrucomicrobiota bacterium]